MATAGDREWTTLSSDLLGLIAERLSLVDYVRFGAVCTTWSSAIGNGGLYRPLAPQSPWLMLAGDSSDICTFFSVSDNKCYRVASSMRKLGEMWFVGSTDGWVVTLDRVSEMQLFNPLTGVQIQLPSTATLPYIEVVRNTQGDVTKFLYHFYSNRDPDKAPLTWMPDQFRGSYIYKVVLSSGPTTVAAKGTTTTTMHGGYTAMAIVRITKDLAFARSGDKKWTGLDSIPGGANIDDVIYHKGMFYTISWDSNGTSQFRVWDLTGTNPNTRIISEVKDRDFETSYRKYLVESSGHLLQVWRHHEQHHLHGLDGEVTTTFITTKVKVFKFDPSGSKWSLVDGLGDRCLFLGLSRSMSLSTIDIPGLMRNCIYFADDHWDGLHSYNNLPRDLGVFNLEDGSFQPYHLCDFLKNGPTPIWFMPNLF